MAFVGKNNSVTRFAEHRIGFVFKILFLTFPSQPNSPIPRDSPFPIHSNPSEYDDTVL